jgi:hypothetical protein
MSDNKALRRKLQNEKLHDLYPLDTKVTNQGGYKRKIEDVDARWQMQSKILVQSKGKDRLRNIGVAGKIILKWILNEYYVRVRTETKCVKLRSNDATS